MRRGRDLRLTKRAHEQHKERNSCRAHSPPDSRTLTEDHGRTPKTSPAGPNSSAIATRQGPILRPPPAGGIIGPTWRDIARMLCPRFSDTVEHKAEHNNCRLRAVEPDSEISAPTVSALLRVRAARRILSLNRCTG